MNKEKMYPESEAKIVWKKGKVKFALVEKEAGLFAPFSYYCGYCIFPKRFLVERGYGGIVIYVPVHGGITYAKEREDGSMVYGFDCAHVGDEDKPELKDINWLKKECEAMAKALRIAKKYEKDYLLAPNNEKRAEVIDKFLREVEEKTGKVLIIEENFGVMINLLFGML